MQIWVLGHLMLPVQRLCLLSVYANAVKPSKKKAVLDHVPRSLLGTQNAAFGACLRASQKIPWALVLTHLLELVELQLLAQLLAQELGAFLGLQRKGHDSTRSVQ